MSDEQTRAHPPTPLPEKGTSRDEIAKLLDEMCAEDLETHNGKAWGYVFDAGPEVSEVQKLAVNALMGKNGLDPTVFPSLEKLENEVLSWCLDHVHGGNEAVGAFTSGGTESCMMAVKSARDYAREKRPNLTDPEMIAPVTIHAANHKGAKYFGVKVVPVGVDPKTFKADMDQVKKAINDKTILLAGSAPGYAHGVVDPIEELGALALEHDLRLHVDGCIGGFILPLFEQMGAKVSPFDFRVPGVTSISMDLHKYGFGPKGSSVVMYRNKDIRRAQYFACARWTGYSVVNSTMQSTKSGGPLAGSWAVMRFLGKEGYLKIAKKIYEATRTLIESIPKIDGLRVLGEPEMGLIGIASDEVDVFTLADELGERGWYVVPQLSFGGSPRNLHLMVEASNAGQADAFIEDLKACTELVRKNPPTPPAEPLVEMAKALTPEMVRSSFKELMAMAGAGGGLPKRRAEINHILDVLPTETKEAFLIEFMSELYS